MLGKLKDSLGLTPNNAMPPNPNTDYDVKELSGRLKAFGGESTGFASDVIGQYGAQAFYGADKTEPDDTTVPKAMSGSLLNRSIFNQYALYNYRGFYGGFSGDVTMYYKDQPNNKLTGGEYAHNLTASRIIEFYNDQYPKLAYKPADFIFGKYYNQIPLNHMITLRRFPLPVEDNIFDNVKQFAPKKGESTIPPAINTTTNAGVTAVTYLSEKAGNKMEDILKYTFGLNWTTQEAKMQTIQNQDGGYTSQPFYKNLGGIGRATFDSLKGVTAQQKFAAQHKVGNGEDRFGETYANFVLGPINVINKTTTRDIGLHFANDITLTFEYELRSLNYVNPKIAMIDIISNMLTMTTNNAQFFGGGQRYFGAEGYTASQFGDINKLRKGDFAGYIGSVAHDVENGFKGLTGNKSGGFSLDGLFKGGLTTAKTFLGNILGGFLNSQIGAIPGVQATLATISAEPTGNWHITVGNPLNPIITAGNMYCDNTSMLLGQGLGYDDFPMEVKFEIDLKHGKPRDKGDIENMFNAGRGRIYASAQGEADILNLKGIDVKVYGAIQNVGHQNKQPTQSDRGLETAGNKAEAASASSLTPASIKKSGATSSVDSIDGLTNIVSMIIDS